MSHTRRDGDSPGRALVALAKRYAELAIDLRVALAGASGRPWADLLALQARKLASEIEEAGVEVMLGRRELGQAGPELPILAAIEARSHPTPANGSPKRPRAEAPAYDGRPDPEGELPDVSPGPAAAAPAPPPGPIREAVIVGGRAGAEVAREPEGPDGRTRFVALNAFKRPRYVARAFSLEAARIAIGRLDVAGALQVLEDLDGIGADQSLPEVPVTDEDERRARATDDPGPVELPDLDAPGGPDWKPAPIRWRDSPADALGDRFAGLLFDTELETLGEAWDALESGALTGALEWSPAEAKALEAALVAIRAEAGDPAPCTGPAAEPFDFCSLHPPRKPKPETPVKIIDVGNLPKPKRVRKSRAKPKPEPAGPPPGGGAPVVPGKTLEEQGYVPGVGPVGSARFLVKSAKGHPLYLLTADSVEQATAYVREQHDSGDQVVDPVREGLVLPQWLTTRGIPAHWQPGVSLGAGPKRMADR